MMVVTALMTTMTFSKSSLLRLMIPETPPYMWHKLMPIITKAHTGTETNEVTHTHKPPHYGGIEGHHIYYVSKGTHACMHAAVLYSTVHPGLCSCTTIQVQVHACKTARCNQKYPSLGCQPSALPTRCGTAATGTDQQGPKFHDTQWSQGPESWQRRRGRPGRFLGTWEILGLCVFALLCLLIWFRVSVW